MPPVAPPGIARLCTVITHASCFWCVRAVGYGGGYGSLHSVSPPGRQTSPQPFPHHYPHSYPPAPAYHHHPPVSYGMHATPHQPLLASSGPWAPSMPHPSMSLPMASPPRFSGPMPTSSTVSSVSLTPVSQRSPSSVTVLQQQHGAGPHVNAFAPAGPSARYGAAGGIPLAIPAHLMTDDSAGASAVPSGASSPTLSFMKPALTPKFTSSATPDVEAVVSSLFKDMDLGASTITAPDVSAASAPAIRRTFTGFDADGNLPVGPLDVKVSSGFTALPATDAVSSASTRTAPTAAVGDDKVVTLQWCTPFSFKPFDPQ